jgi:hypothetical protein
MKEIPLTQGKVALVDDEDYSELSKYKWYAHKGGNTYYADRHPKKIENLTKTITMHLFLMGPHQKRMQIDHVNGNGLDNRRENLRVITCRQNQQNQHVSKTSIYPGVYRDKRDNRWCAIIRINKQRIHLGTFESEIDAFNRYCDRLKQIGETLLK